MKRRTSLALAATVAVLGLVASCGLPDDGSSRTLQDEDVPYGLLDDPGSSQGDGTSPSATAPGKPQLFWVDDEGQLAPMAAPVSTEDTYTLLGDVLGLLADGPDDEQRASGLGTALSPDTGFAVTEITGKTAVIDVDPGSQDPSAERLPLAVGQVVLTSTSLPGVDRVLLTGDHEKIEVPLPGGALTSDPLSATDYATLRAPHPSEAPSSHPTSR